MSPSALTHWGFDTTRSIMSSLGRTPWPAPPSRRSLQRQHDRGRFANSIFKREAPRGYGTFVHAVGGRNDQNVDTVATNGCGAHSDDGGNSKGKAADLRTAGETSLSLILNIERGQSGSTLQRQVYAQIRDGILSATFHPAMSLPSSRRLADDLGVSRNTVMLAYEWLINEGYIQTQPGVGTFVTKSLPENCIAVAAKPDGTIKRARSRQGRSPATHYLSR